MATLGHLVPRVQTLSLSFSDNVIELRSNIVSGNTPIAPPNITIIKDLNMNAKFSVIEFAFLLFQ